MREIKFRGMSAQTGLWVYGNYIHSCRFAGCSNEYRIHETWSGLETDVISETVGQFTGRQDKRGIDIYEGDILKTYPIISSEGIGDDSFNIEVKWSGSCFIANGILGALQAEISEVIGNIHQNPELLNKEEDK